jgi:hypothetical protein
MTTQARRAIERERDDRRAFAAQAWLLARTEAADGDVRSIERAARSAEVEAARIDGILKRFPA